MKELCPTLIRKFSPTANKLIFVEGHLSSGIGLMLMLGGAAAGFLLRIF